MTDIRGTLQYQHAETVKHILNSPNATTRALVERHGYTKILDILCGFLVDETSAPYITTEQRNAYREARNALARAANATEEAAADKGGVGK